MKKPFWKSWTVILNLSAFIVAAYDQFAPFIPHQWEPKLALVLAAANFALRFKATQPIGLPVADGE